MTNDAPERIWVWRNAPHGELVVSGPDVPRLTVSSEYIRKDVLDAAVAAEREACAKKVENTAAWKFYSYTERDRIAESVRARTDTDALEAAKAEAQAEALVAADKLGHHCIGCGHLCGDPEKDLRMLRKLGAKACCPERKMEPLSAAILSLIPADQEGDQ
ncbi:MAG: hypothetical protein RI553_12055 [Salibaculum sp.]|uniref:hypothetical protein n=1 Tax=Salibaculum sp. TaxID=2855480 RepID=UPI0028705E2D|nr:hypothetical protein [Salibaculum sp.]MDR9428826.1 hypothetical protein [Salibaculum sp.]